MAGKMTVRLRTKKNWTKKAKERKREHSVSIDNTVPHKPLNRTWYNIKSINTLVQDDLIV